MNRKEYLKNYYKKNRQAYLARAKKWYHANKEDASAYHKQYYQENKERCLALSKAWELKNKEKRKEYQKKYQRNRKRTGYPKLTEEKQLIAKAIIKVMGEQTQRKIPDDIDLEFKQFCLLWERVSELMLPEDCFIWIDLPNPRFNGSTPKQEMINGGIHKVLYFVGQGKL